MPLALIVSRETDGSEGYGSELVGKMALAVGRRGQGCEAVVVVA